jgi:predicted nucleic acid-binding protein
VRSHSAVALDTSVLIAGLLSWHENHQAAARALEAALTDPAGAVLPLQALVEAYAVMTRLPAPHRLRPDAAAEILRLSLADRVRLVTLDEPAGWQLIASLAEAGVAGGRTYDALIAACARAAAAGRLVTLNQRDFAAVAPDLDLLVP